MIKRTLDFFVNGIWNIRLNTLTPLRACLIRLCRITVLTLRFFFRNRCTLHAASLTYYTLLAIVPILALVFGIAKGYGYDRILKQKLMDSMQGNESVAERMIDFADSAIKNASGGLVAGIGVLLLLWTAVKLLASIENSFNRIWGVKSGRSWGRKFCDYLTMLLICPFLLTVMATTSSFVITHLEGLAGNMPYPDTWIEIVKYVVHGLNLVSAWFVFTFVYMFVPNTKVHLKAGIIAGVLAGTGYLVLQAGYVFVQTKLTSYNAIYGSFAALPFFLIWMNLGWTLTIFGAQFSFAIQNVNLYEMEPGNGDLPLCPFRKKVCALRITNLFVRTFAGHEKPKSAAQVSKELEIPIRTARAIIYDLCEAGILAPLMSEKGEDDCYQVAIPPDEITPAYVLRKLDCIGADFALPANDPEFEQLMRSFWNHPDKQLNTPFYQAKKNS